jgi:hypothetical protein
MSDTVNRALHVVVFRAISLAGNLVVLPFALAGRRAHR